MDLLDDLLSGVRARGATFCRSVAEPPWAVRFASDTPLVLGAMLQGDAWITPDGAEPVRAREGDIVLVRGHRSFVVGDRPETEAQIVVEGADRCWLTAEGPDSDGCDFLLGPRTYGLTSKGSDLLVTAEYAMRGDVCERLLRALPELVVVPAQPAFTPLLDLLSTEIALEDPGQQVILDRLLDMLLVRVVRAWFARPDVEPPAGYRALGDPQIGRALRLLHDEPARPWTVAGLAAETGMSRAVFARRFTELVGRPPLAYLTEWRMAVAADLLREDGASVTSVARKVGYSDGFAFSNAFKRVRGEPPSTILRASAGGAAAGVRQPAP
ncbi:AraC family transcriptional regulator [Actinomadura barringtoniae]|uniref:AraC family transcriptional regulator n=1 Tax=Actinomadura barringtoniae TaxID=1427535 RepID=A0A939T7L4_9ACTN|nr:AraC family transcriptional regulator [Actinomadura barringtoniae]MBO2449407.1 AraC family transcriptional regulator [Actinomadura barringtoniae]